MPNKTKSRYYLLLIVATSFLFFTELKKASAQNYQWLLYPTLGVDVGGAIPIPVSDKPGGVAGSPKIMPSLGMGFQYALKQKWHAAIEVNYHNLSFSAEGPVRSQPFYFDNNTDVLYFSGDTYTDVELRFVEFPLLFAYQISTNWTIMLGAYYSRIIEGRFDTEGKNGVLSPDKDITDNAALPGTAKASYSFSDELDVNDYGFLLGYKYMLNHKLFFWGRFTMGVKSIFVPEFENIDYELYQMRLNVGVSYIFFSGKDL